MNKILKERLEECNITIESILENIILNTSNTTVFVYTSHLEGLGTKDSDFDVYVLCESIPDEIARTNHVEPIVKNLVIEDTLIDIEYWTISQIDSLINKLTLNDSSMMIDQLKILNRLKVGEILFNENLGDELKNKLLNTEENMKDKVIESFLIGANSYLEDAVHMYNAKEYFCSLSCSYNALEYTIGGVNAKNGFTNLKLKWVPKIFMNNNGYDKSLLDQYLKYQIYTEINENNIETFAEEKMEFIQNLISLITI